MAFSADADDSLLGVDAWVVVVEVGGRDDMVALDAPPGADAGDGQRAGRIAAQDPLPLFFGQPFSAPAWAVAAGSWPAVWSGHGSSVVPGADNHSRQAKRPTGLDRHAKYSDELCATSLLSKRRLSRRRRRCK